MAASGIVEVVQTVKLAALPCSNVVEVVVLGDGSCFFHALLRATNLAYIESTSIFDRMKRARVLRSTLAQALTIDVGDGKVYYDTLALGRLRELSKTSPEVSLSAMVAELQSTHAVSNIYHELVASKLGVDVYLIDMKHGDVYLTGAPISTLYQGRTAIFVAVHPGHYNILGLRGVDGLVYTHLAADHPFTKQVYARAMSKLRHTDTGEVCLFG